MSVLGVIGGSGLYAIEGLQNVQEIVVKTPFGAPSDALIQGTVGGTTLYFLPRHGRGHSLSPSEINYRANIWALKKVGVTDIVSVSAVGSMRENMVPGDIVLPDQFIDRTVDRPRTFFEGGVVAHVGFADPVSERVRSALRRCCESLELTHHVGGTYVCIEGPQFSTRAESHTFRTWHDVAVIGMTNLPEARLAREAELPYATMAMVTDFDCWNDAHDAVTVEQVVTTLTANVEKARRVLLALAHAPPTGECPSQTALQHAIMTKREAIDPQAWERVSLLAGKYFDQ